MDRGGDDAVVEQQAADRQGLLRHREEAQARAEALQDEGHHHQPQRLLAEQAAVDQVGDQADEEGDAQADVVGILDHPVGQHQRQPVRPQRLQRRRQRQQAEQQRHDQAQRQHPLRSGRGSSARLRRCGLRAAAVRVRPVRRRRLRGSGGVPAGRCRFRRCRCGRAARRRCPARSRRQHGAASGRRGVEGGRAGQRARLAQQHQHFAAAIELRRGRDVADQEGAAVVGPQRGDGADREARRRSARPGPRSPARRRP